MPRLLLTCRQTETPPSAEPSPVTTESERPVKPSTLIIILTVLLAPVPLAADEDGWITLFDGTSLDGWHNPYDWGQAAIVDDEIHLTANKKFFLVTSEQYADFEFEAEILLPDGKANSGFMFRCHVEPNRVYGYQAEVDGSDRRWSGGLYDEGRRKWLWPGKANNSKDPKAQAHIEESQQHFQQPEIRNAFRRSDWNRYRITCRGDRLQIEVNGVLITDYADSVDAKGYIALQHHGENGQTYRFRNVKIRRLPAVQGTGE